MEVPHYEKPKLKLEEAVVVVVKLRERLLRACWVGLGEEELVPMLRIVKTEEEAEVAEMGPLMLRREIRWVLPATIYLAGVEAWG